MARKIRAAVAARNNRQLFVIARTDARAVHGLSEALRRAERYLGAGADGIFIEAPESVEELEAIGRAFDVPQVCNMLVGGRTPLLPTQVLHEMGFQMIVHGTTLIKRVARAIQLTLTELRCDELDYSGTEFLTLSEFLEVMSFGWRRFGKKELGTGL